MEQTSHLRRTDHLSLAALLSAVACSRLFVRHVFTRWHIPEEQREDAELLTSELVTNAVRATGITEPRPSDSAVHADVKLIGIRLLQFEHGMVIEVWDTSPELPVLRTAGHDTEHGRGLQLVDALSARWGHYYARIGGKVVWCELGLTPGEANSGWDRDPERPGASSKTCRH